MGVTSQVTDCDHLIRETSKGDGVGWDALHEQSRRTSLVKFVTNGNERLGASSDSSRFSPFWWENLLEEVGE